jgi:hypothetical protein
VKYITAYREAGGLSRKRIQTYDTVDNGQKWVCCFRERVSSSVCAHFTLLALESASISLRDRESSPRVLIKRSASISFLDEDCNQHMSTEQLHTLLLERRTGHTHHRQYKQKSITCSLSDSWSSSLFHTSCCKRRCWTGMAVAIVRPCVQLEHVSSCAQRTLSQLWNQYTYLRRCFV